MVNKNSSPFFLLDCMGLNKRLYPTMLKLQRDWWGCQAMENQSASISILQLKNILPSVLHLRCKKTLEADRVPTKYCLYYRYPLGSSGMIPTRMTKQCNVFLFMTWYCIASQFSLKTKYLTIYLLNGVL